ncbi:MAG: ATPase [Gammaproteobacteria bacterium CG11_big_fil_rev_8_21_14_0_20_46_22]|nr:MAG: ATPase [Gammaproteobacteria bacterium CG12_big_fil_rev_8_21_14_0_65_46_12]PIR10559.1 MAG: ATPase [Gammaproteobacteria bacterium CG11_big_fil_rev_8_21_14_0_20_46_22]
MPRHIMSQLATWKAKKNRKPLILKGSRQVGKTYSLKAFGQKAYDQVVYLNFETQLSLHSLFKEGLEPNGILDLISLDQGVKITPESTLLIFDEIQACPEALNSLKYFYEKTPEYHIAAAGSLLGVKLAHTAGFPVGKVDFLTLYPMSFSEFLVAVGENPLADYLNTLQVVAPVPDIMHVKLNKLFKYYLYIGGMPEAVAHYAENQDILTVRSIQNNILAAYELDFSKHAPKNEIMRISQVWQSLAAQLAKENRKFIYSVIRKGARAKEFEIALQWLIEAGLLNKVTLINKPCLPLQAYAKFEHFKVYLLDVGLLGASVNLPARLLAQEEKILEEFSGILAENYVAQALLPIQSSLFYWTSEGEAELDFVLQYEDKIYPIEVKSGQSTRKKSLLIYAKKYQPDLLIRFSTLNLKKDGDVLNCPLYLIDKLLNFLSHDHSQ